MIASPDLATCDREPITRLETIQGFGFLIALSRDWEVVRASANLADFLGVDGDASIGMPLSTLMTVEVIHELRNRVLVMYKQRGSERLYGMRLQKDGSLFDLAMHQVDGLLVIEGEHSGPSDGPDTASQIRTMVARLDRMKTFPEFHRDCARQIRALTGFNRVMIYRFDEDEAGEVIAESVSGNLQSLLGLHYPATDIPVQARALYLRNAFRIIGDVAEAGVPLCPRASSTIPELDLSLAITRAVSPVHLEYLRNMGVAASLSISIIVEGRLWGLIACHHDTPRVPHFVKRSASELFAQMYSMILESRLSQASRIADAEAERLTDAMIGAIANDRQLLFQTGWLHGVLHQIVECDGVAVVIKGRSATSGVVPPQKALDTLVAVLGARPPGKIFATRRIAAELDPAADSGLTAGVLSIPLSIAAGDHLLLFRRERTLDTLWGGDPFKGPSDERERLSPRKSFDAFNVKTHGESPTFTPANCRAAEAIRSALIERVLQSSDRIAADTSKVTARQELLIAELNHRVRNVLALIRGLINQTATGAHDVASYVQSLNGRVQALARAHDQVTQQNWGPGLLSSLFEYEIGAYVPTQHERFQVFGEAIYLSPEAFSTLALVIHELVTNSLKYGALCDSGRVEVRIEHRAEVGICIAWRESGGPPVKPPTRRGFGSSIIERTIPFDLDGSSEVRYPHTGLEADIVIPERWIWSEPMHAPTLPGVVQRAESESGRPLEGMQVLLLEDNMIVALETEDMLDKLGAARILTVATIATALLAVEGNSIDFAVLDVNVGQDNSLSFAAHCAEAGIPFIFASGYGHNVEVQNRYPKSSIVNKPYLLADIASSASAALQLHRIAEASHKPTHGQRRAARKREVF